MIWAIASEKSKLVKEGKLLASVTAAISFPWLFDCLFCTAYRFYFILMKSLYVYCTGRVF